MASIRRDLDNDVDEIVENVNELTKLQYYMRNYPWLLLGGAAFLGYWVIPSRYEIHSPDPETLEKLAKRNKLVVNHDPEPQKRGGVLGGLFSMVSTMVVRGATAYAGAKIGELLNTGSSQSSPKNPQAAASNQAAAAR